MSSHNPPSPKVPAGGTDREVPRPVRFVKSGVIYRKITLKERFLVLLGFNVVLEVHIATEHAPGNMQPLTELHFTGERDVEAARKEVQAKAQAKQRKEGVKINANRKG